MLQVPHLARLSDFGSTCMFRSCVSSGGGGWVSAGGAVHMAAALAGCRKAPF